MWKKIAGIDYSINEMGQVKNDKTGRILKSVPDPRDGYLMVCLRSNGSSRMHRIHRLLGVYFLSCPTDMQIDHIDGDRKNNALSNLRIVNNQHNHFNRTTAKGYTWNKQASKWQAQIKTNGKNKHLGSYDTEKEARASYLRAKAIFHVIPAESPE